MADPADLARRWTEAYRDGRDDDVLELAHPDVVLRPRRGQGEQEYRGLDGVRRWLEAAVARPALRQVSVEMLEDGRVLQGSEIDGMPVLAVFDIRDDKIVGVAVYLSDRELLEQIGVLPGARS